MASEDLRSSVYLLVRFKIFLDRGSKRIDVAAIVNSLVLLCCEECPLSAVLRQILTVVYFRGTWIFGPGCGGEIEQYKSSLYQNMLVAYSLLPGRPCKSDHVCNRAYESVLTISVKSESSLVFPLLAHAQRSVPKSIGCLQPKNSMSGCPQK